MPEQERCSSCEMAYPVAWMRKEAFGRFTCRNCDGQTMGVTLGISQAEETCCRCGKHFPNTWGSEEPPLHRNLGKPCCPECISLDCERCGRHVPGKMRPIPGTCRPQRSQSNEIHSGQHGLPRLRWRGGSSEPQVLGKCLPQRQHVSSAWEMPRVTPIVCPSQFRHVNLPNASLRIHAT